MQRVEDYMSINYNTFNYKKNNIYIYNFSYYYNMDIKQITENKSFLTISLVIAILLIFFLIRRAIHVFYKKIQKNSVISKARSAKRPSSIKYDNIPTSQYGTDYTYSFWIYINDWDYKLTQYKHVFHIGDEKATATSPGVWLTPYKNNLVVKVNTQSNKRYTSGRLGVAKNQICKFPYKWNWDKLNIHTLDQINNLGIEKFHTSVSNSYFTWKSINDDFIKGLFNFLDKQQLANIDPKNLLTKHNGFTITQHSIGKIEA